MKQWRLVGMLSILGLLGAGIFWSGSAGADGASATFTFSAVRQQVVMDIPPGPCPTGASSCTWMLYVNEPGVSGQPTVAEVTGTSGTLSIPYPPNFCGVIQADALVGPGNWVYQTGTREIIHTCPEPIVAPVGGGGGTNSTGAGGGSNSTGAGGGSNSTGTGGTSSSTLNTSTGASTSSSSATDSATSLDSATTSGTSSGTTPATTISATTGTTAADTTTLPFTGIDISPILLAGLAAVAIGIILVAEPRSVRRLRWLTDTGAARQLGGFLDWFIGH